MHCGASTASWASAFLCSVSVHVECLQGSRSYVDVAQHGSEACKAQKTMSKPQADRVHTPEDNEQTSSKQSA